MSYHKDNLESLHSQIPKKMLPTHLGGDAGDMQDIISKGLVPSQTKLIRAWSHYKCFTSLFCHCNRPFTSLFFNGKSQHMHCVLKKGVFSIKRPLLYFEDVFESPLIEINQIQIFK